LCHLDNFLISSLLGKDKLAIDHSADLNGLMREFFSLVQVNAHEAGFVFLSQLSLVFSAVRERQ